MTVGSIIQGGFRLLKERPGAVLIWTLIQLAMTIAVSYVTVAMIQGQIADYLAGATEQEIQLTQFWQSGLLALVALMGSTILYAAALRAVLRPDEGGPGWLRLGMDEVRLYLLTLLYLIIFVVALIVVGFGVAIFTGGAGPDASEPVAIVVVIVMCVAGAYFGTKLSLTFPLTLMRKSFAIGEGWSLTTGRFWTLFAAYLILFLLLFAVAVLIFVATEQEYLQAILRHGITSPEAQQASLREYEQLSTQGVDGQIILQWALASVQAGLGVALLGGAVATAAKELAGEDPELSDTFA